MSEPHRAGSARAAMSEAHRAKKSLGQNFLVDANQQRRIVAALEPDRSDVVLEIGPGQGALTRQLAPAVGRLILVELDNTLAAALRREYEGDDHVTVVHADFLDVELDSLVDDVASLKVIGNIPYNITTPIIFRLLERAVRPACIVLMIQKEVAARILAPAGSAEYGALSVGVRSVASAERLFHVGRASFRPAPRVDSTVIRITPLRPPPLSAAEEADLRGLTRAAFSWRRKQLQKTLRAAPAYQLDAAQVASLQRETGISMARRPEEIEPAAFITLSRALRALGRPLQHETGS